VGTLVYALCALTSLLCAVLLLRAYVHARVRLLFWSAVGFTGLAITNALVFADFVIVPDFDLSLIRAATACAAITVLLLGLLWEGES
jgi:hypothetical protein